MLLSYNSCIISSFIFLTNAFVAYILQYKIYSLLFLLLWISSILFHTYKDIYTNILDKIIIFTIFIYGGYLFYTKNQQNQNNLHKIFIILSFLSTIFLYLFIIYQKDKYTKTFQNKLHSLLHIIGSLGHHLIVFL
jgi:hypothetical protein